MTELTVAPLEPEQFDGLAWFLNAAGLPSSDLGDPGRTFYRIDAESLIGYAGLEGEGDDRLLRSVVVLHDRRRAGLGRPLVAAIEKEAREIGVRRLHLLTTTASGFFRAIGYLDADRVSAPSSIAASREFTALCPASATYLVKVL
ncbi:hypothetical protein GCM10011380_35790 [Sphingomonas metalli]|uniref:N-acetyltransferase domain-containing protein n=1 Tax=Sphingomonas metalli TaxID=1779358 RepID=A0A916TID7_9SPHN|nr:arsenic resistance N-acetyltransferase ArsN2 [Sphingomonas metalli]GGB43144.1 hypothetical protein GCM10011380_35790 [Sphingomonas metalli]